MGHNLRWWILSVVAYVTVSEPSFAECAITEEAKTRDPVEVGYCESDIVFVGKVEQRLETARAFRPEGATKTQHFRTETSTVRVLNRYKGTPPDKVTMIADLYDPQAAYSFENGREYLVFAKRLSGENQYAGASPACSVQPTLSRPDAEKALKQLEQHLKGRKRIDCKNIRAKEQE